MLLPIKRLLDLPIMSLQTGTELGRTHDVIIDPRQLRIAAFIIDSPSSQVTLVLHPNDIRELSDIGMIVDSDERLMSLDGLVRLQQVIDFDFELIGLKIIDEHKRKLGKVNDYSVEPGDYTIQQLYTQQSLLKSLSTMSNTIHRSQVISVNNERIVVHSPTVRDEVKTTAKDAAQAFVNPFRSGHQPES